jgi:hypothetical protein
MHQPKEIAHRIIQYGSPVQLLKKTGKISIKNLTFIINLQKSIPNG